MTLPEERLSYHRYRRMILNYIKEHPGASRRLMSSILQIQESTLRYHLLRLERGGYIDIVRNDGHLRYYRRAVAGDAFGDHPDLTRDQCRIVKVISDNPYITLSGIVSLVPLGNESVRDDLQRLLRRRIISRMEDGQEPSYYIQSSDQIKLRSLEALIAQLASHEIDEPTFLRLKEELDQRYH